VRPSVRIPAVATLLAVLAALGANAWSGADRAGGSTLRSVNVSERDFKISAPKRVRAGVVRLTAHNKGPDTHELIVVRGGSRRLPLRADGLTVDEEALEPQIVTTIEGFEPGSERRVRLHLRPGRYELFCNMAGHYLGGMHAQIVVQ
jgi:uncharacterized cupredoxin-like copper-binding protein